MKKTRIAAMLLVMVLVVGLAACGKHSLTLELLDEASGVRVTAENAGSDDIVSSEGAITVSDGDVIIISPCMDKGGFHLTITGDDGATVVYDEDVDGRIWFQTGAVPGTYDVAVSGTGGSTGWMTVFSASADDLEAEGQSLEEALTDAGIDPSTLSNG